MTEPKSTSIVKAIERALSRIETHNGYFTDLGENVIRGFYAHALKDTDQKFPLIAIQTDTESVEATRAGKTKVDATLRLVVVTNTTYFPTDILRACVADIRRAFALEVEVELKALEVSATPEPGTVEFAIVADSPLTLAAMSVGFNFVETYEV